MTKRYKNAKDWICKYCKCVVKSRAALYKHYTECTEKQALPTDSLGRVKVPGIGKKSAETFKQKVAEGLATYKGHAQSEQTRRHLSEMRTKYLEEHANHGVHWYTVNGIKVQGKWEKRFAEFLNSKNITWKRVKIKYAQTHTYTPDFYCPDYDVYFEIKGFRKERDLYKMYLVLREHPELKIKMIEQNEYENLENIDIFSLPNFNEIYKFEDIDVTKFKNVW